MGLYTVGLQKQQTSASSGVKTYPNLGQAHKDVIIKDEFLREALNPTNAVVLYTVTSNDSNGTAAIQSGNLLRITTDNSAIGDDIDVRTSGFTLPRTALDTNIDSRSQLKLTIVVKIAGSTVGQECFFGIINSQAALSALPTTAAHLGFEFNDSDDSTWQFTSANGSSQVSADTTSTYTASTFYKMEIIWTGNDSAVLNMFSGGTDLSSGFTLDGTTTVTSLQAGSLQFGMELHFFMQAEGTAAELIDIREWSLEVT